MPVPRWAHHAKTVLALSLAVFGLLASQTRPATAAGTVAISAGRLHVCALNARGGVQCWGSNLVGQLGAPSTEACGSLNLPCSRVPLPVRGLSSGVTASSAGGAHTCALLADGSVQCWGYNANGQLGDGTTVDRASPVPVSGLKGTVLAIAAGESHTCVLTAVHGVACWGENGDGQLGDGTTADRLTPADVTGLAEGVAAIAAGARHTCAALVAGGVKCWGDNFLGQLGDDTVSDRTTPTDVLGLDVGIALLASGGRHNCVLTVTGGLLCWGSNSFGELGDGTQMDSQTAPVQPLGLGSGVVALSLGDAHTCAVTSQEQTYCWGQNLYGQLGIGTSGTAHYLSWTPIEVANTEETVAIDLGVFFTCRLVRRGPAECWGENGSGQLADGTTTDQTRPVKVRRLNLKLIGDVNCSGAVDSIDAVLVLQLSAQLLGSLGCSEAADANGDGRTNAIDSTLILQFAAGLVDNLPPSSR